MRQLPLLQQASRVGQLIREAHLSLVLWRPRHQHQELPKLHSSLQRSPRPQPRLRWQQRHTTGTRTPSAPGRPALSKGRELCHGNGWSMCVSCAQWWATQARFQDCRALDRRRQDVTDAQVDLCLLWMVQHQQLLPAEKCLHLVLELALPATTSKLQLHSVAAVASSRAAPHRLTATTLSAVGKWQAAMLDCRLARPANRHTGDVVHQVILWPHVRDFVLRRGVLCLTADTQTLPLSTGGGDSVAGRVV
jgi:hypothetical protein